MALFWKYCKHWKIILTLILMAGYSFNGVLLSSIIVQASKLTRESSVREVLQFGIISFIAWIIIYVTNYLFAINVASMIKEINISLKNRLYYNSFRNNSNKSSISGILSNITNDMKLIETNYLSNIFSVYSNGLLCIVSFFYIFYLNITVSLIFISFSFLPMLVPKLFGVKLDSAAKRWSLSSERFTKQVKESLQGANVLKTYGSSDSTLNRTDYYITDMENENFSLIRIQSRAELLAAVLSGISFLFPFIIGCLLIVSGSGLSLSVLIAIFLANDRVVGPLRELSNSMNRIRMTQQLRKSLIDDVQIAVNETIGDNNADGSNEHCRVESLDLNGIEYKISKQKKLRFNIKFEGNFKVLIQGDSGTGKTTILKLIKGTISPTRGVVLLKGMSGAPLLDPQNIAYIEQTPFIFDTTVMENITLFQSNEFDAAEVVSVLKKVSLYEELGGNKSLNRQCGENGSQLSGGQRQRIEIARALIRNKSLYLVDEATANLDFKNSKLIRDILFNLKEPVIEVAHHFDMNETRYTQKLILKDGSLEELTK